MSDEATTTNTMTDSSSEPPQNAQLEALKEEIQQSFNRGQFDNAMKKSSEALEIIKDLPPNQRIPETIQIHVNLSTACIHMNRIPEAVKHATLSVENAEKGLELAPENPQAHEILAITLNSLSQALMLSGNLDGAHETAERSIGICEKIYPKNDPRIHKPLRTLSLVLDKKGLTAEAEKALMRAYLLLHISVGPQVPEAQMLTEDLVGFYMRKNDIDAAEAQALKNYKGIVDRPSLNDRDQLVLADSATRLGTLYMRRNKFSEAEPLIEKALHLREQSRIFPRNPIGNAFSIVQLCAVREKMDKLDQSSVQMMMRAIDIFSKVKGPQSPEVANSVAQLQTIRGKLNEQTAKSSSQQDEEDDKLEYTVKDAKKPAQKASEKLVSDAKSNAKTNEINEDDRKKMASLKPNDANTRMVLANMYFEQAKYNCAEILLSEALAIFESQVGPEHQATKAARQNLNVVRNNRLNQLWMEVVSEESLALRMQSLSLNDSVGDDEAENEQNASNAYARLIKQAATESEGLTLEEKMFLEMTNNEENNSSGCVIC